MANATFPCSTWSVSERSPLVEKHPVEQNTATIITGRIVTRIYEAPGVG
jgi:hypothetical protein